MSTRTKKAARVAVEYGGVSIGENTARVGIKIDREDMELSLAEELFCGRRLTGRIETARTNEHPDQQNLTGMDDVKYKIESVFDVKRMGVSPKNITAGLTFSLGEIDVSDLGHFAKRSGWLIVENAVELEDSEEEDEE